MTNQGLQFYTPSCSALPDCTKPHEVRTEKPDSVMRQSYSDTRLHRTFFPLHCNFAVWFFLLIQQAEKPAKEKEYEL